MLAFEQIGHVSNAYDSHVECLELKDSISELIIYEQYLDGLKDIEQHVLLQIIFEFHHCKNDGYSLIDTTYKGKATGIFASRCYRRPNNIGLTTVELLERSENRLKVRGLDALNGSPILDIKPYNFILDSKR